MINYACGDGVQNYINGASSSLHPHGPSTANDYLQSSGQCSSRGGKEQVHDSTQRKHPLGAPRMNSERLSLFVSIHEQSHVSMCISAI